MMENFPITKSTRLCFFLHIQNKFSTAGNCYILTILSIKASNKSWIVHEDNRSSMIIFLRDFSICQDPITWVFKLLIVSTRRRVHSCRHMSCRIYVRDISAREKERAEGCWEEDKILVIFESHRWILNISDEHSELCTSSNEKFSSITQPL